MPLPSLREELALHSGPILADGQPTWILQDPSRNRFFHIDWQTFEILSRWALDDPQSMANDVALHTTLQPDEEDVLAVIRFLADSELLQPTSAGSAGLLADQLRKRKGSWGHWLLHNYLFFRVPLVKPDAWLERWLGLAALFYSKTFLGVTLLALLVGGVQVWRRWDQFYATLVDTVSWQGLMGYGIALMLVKTLHELGHAFTAKRYGCRVPAMGVALLVLWPVAYTDTNEVWKLANRHQRLAVAAAGVATELVIAVWATLAWALLPDGYLKSLAFLLATVTWVTTLVINASPFLRFDGYFVLSDWLDMPNLHSRSFALARWDLRERLFGLGDPPPEYFSPRRTRGLILFAYATWLYRLVVFLGIAVLVYHFFIKVVGILLFVVEILWFILLPVWSEITVWLSLRSRLKTSARAWRSALWMLFLLLLAFVPWPTRIAASAYLKPAEVYPVYAPAGAQIVSLPWRDTHSIAQGEVLLEMASPDLVLRWQSATQRLARVREQAALAGLDEQQRQNLQVLQQEQPSAQAELASIQTEMLNYAPRAPFAGQLVDLHPDLRPGVWVRNREHLATLVRPDGWQVIAYLDEEAVRRVSVGNAANFIADGLEGPLIPLRVLAIDDDVTRVLPDGLLATEAGGSVLSREQEGRLIPERAVYRITFAPEGSPGTLEGHSWRGQVVVQGAWEAPAMSYVRSALALVWREAGF